MCIISGDIGQKTIVDAQESETSGVKEEEEGSEWVLEKVQHPLMESKG